MTEHQITCPACDSAEVAIVSAPRQVRAVDGENLEFTDQFSKCSRCGEEFYTRDQSLASSRASAAALRKHEGLLQPEQIRAIRESYGLTQAQFERALRIGPKTVVRWENGTVRQGATANSLLVAIEGNVAAFQKVALANGFTDPIQAKRASGKHVYVTYRLLDQMQVIDPLRVAIGVASTSGKRVVRARRPAASKFKVVKRIDRPEPALKKVRVA